jgi:hemerythrin superfamily protein
MEILMATPKLDAVALLKADHRKVEDLFAQFEKTKAADKKQRLAQEICKELTVHTLIEEEIFYPACRGEIKDETVSEAYVEHDGAKMLIAELEAGSPEDDFYDAKMKVLSEEIKHHVHEEEMRSEGMFAQAKAAGLDLEDLGERMAARKKDLIGKIAAEGLPAPKTRTVTGPALEKGAPLSEAPQA